MSIKIFVTGRPGIGKTTLVSRVVKIIRQNGYSVGGIVTEEFREKGVRRGFKIIDIGSNKTGVLAGVDLNINGPRIGKYIVNLIDLDNIGVKAIENAVKYSDLIVIDEIGPMELYSEKFRNIVLNIMNMDKPLLATVHWKIGSRRFGKRILSYPNIRIFKLTLYNRGYLYKDIAEIFLRYLRERSSSE